MSDTRKSFCRNCSALCAMSLEVEDNRITSVSGDGSASPYGAYMCVKGRNNIDFMSAPDRLKQSLKRCEEGGFTPVATTAALDDIAARLKHIIDESGPRALALYHGTGAYRSVLGAQLEKSFLAAVGTPNLFSSMTIDQSAKWVTTGRMGVMASGKPALDDIDLAVLVGNNPVVSHQTYPFSAGESGAPGKAYLRAKARGMRMIVVDPRKTETARLADLHLAVLPGQDARLFAAIAHALLRDGRFNSDFCDRFVDQLDELRAAVAPFSPANVAVDCGVTEADIEQAAHWIGEAQRAFVGSGTGPSMSQHSNLNDHMIEAVNALVGGYRRAGDVVRNPGTLKPRKFVEMAVPPSRSWERGAKCVSADAGQLFGEFPTALLPGEIQHSGPNNIRALIVFGGDPLMALGDPNVAIPTFEHLDLLVCLDSRLNETGKLAHYVVATTTAFERHDLSIPGDSLYPRAFAQYTRPVVAPPPDTIDDWAFFWEVAARMDLSLTLKYWSYGQQFDAIPDGFALDMQQRPDPEALFRFLCKNSRVDFDTLLAHPEGVSPPAADEVVLPAPANATGRLQLCPPDVVAELQHLLGETTSKEFSHYLCSRRILEAMNTAYRDSPRTRKRYPVNWAYMCSEDMDALALKDGDEIRIASANGAIRALAKRDPGLRRGIVSMTHMFGELLSDSAPLAAAGSYTGRLTSLTDNLESINFMPLFSGLPVNVDVV